MSQWDVLYTKEGSSIGKAAIWKHSRRSQLMAKHCICAVLVQNSYETGHCNCAVVGTHLLGRLRDCQFHWANRVILLDTQNSVYGEAGAQSGRVSAIRDQKKELALRLVFSKDAVLTGLHCYI